MKLSNFEQDINPTILQRGKSYFQTSTIETLEEQSEGKWQAQVEGTDLYTVDVKLSGDTITHHYCNCPYVIGNVCKHEVAVFYALYALKQNKSEFKKPGSRPKKMTIKKKVQVILDKLSEKELKDYLQQKVLDNTKQRDYFLIHFEYLLGESINPEKYRKMVQSIIYNYSDHGFIDYHASTGVCNELMELLDQAEAAMQHNPEQAFVISRIVLEAIPGMAESMDDSNGESGNVSYGAIDIILGYLQQADQKSIQPAFEWCMQTYLNDGYSDYGYDEVDRLFDFFCSKDTPYKDQLLYTLNKKIAKAGEYGKSGLLSTKAELLMMWGNQSASRKIIMENLEEPRFRQILIDEALEADNPEEAIKLIKEGIKIAEQKRHPGTVSNWVEKLLSIAQQQQNQEGIVIWAELLLLNGFSIENYRLLKQSAKDWARYYPELLGKLKGSEHSLAQVYAEEKDHPSLFELIQKRMLKKGHFMGYRSSLSMLYQYMDLLKPYYPAEILDLFTNDIYQRAENTGRNIYAEIVKDLKTMKNLKGGKDRVISIIGDLQLKYKNRPAMQEMLLDV